MPFTVTSPELEDMRARLEKLEARDSGLTMPRKSYYSVKEAAAFLNVSQRQIHRYIGRKLLVRSMVDRKIQIPADSLEAMRKLCQ